MNCGGGILFAALSGVRAWSRRRREGMGEIGHKNFAMQFSKKKEPSVRKKSIGFIVTISININRLVYLL